MGSDVDLATETTGTIASADSVEAIFKSFDNSADKIGLTGKLAETFLANGKATYNATSTDFSSSGAILTSGTIVLNEGNSSAAVNDVTSLKDLFADAAEAAKYALKAGSEVILVTKSAADTNGYSFWYVNGGALDAKSDDIVVLLGNGGGGQCRPHTFRRLLLYSYREWSTARLRSFLVGCLGIRGIFPLLRMHLLVHRLQPHGSFYIEKILSYIANTRAHIFFTHIINYFSIFYYIFFCKKWRK